MNNETKSAQFMIKGLANVKHLNVRKEGPEDDKVLAVDIKIGMDRIDRRLCAYFDDALESFLWRGETNALIVRNIFLEPVKFNNEIKDATVHIAGRTFYGCRISKFAITPEDGGVIHLALSVSAYPNAGEVSELAKLVQDESPIEIEGPTVLF
jgi:hypothetical protein